MTKIEIQNRQTKQVVASYSAAEFIVKRNRAKVKARKIRPLTRSEFDALIGEVLGGGRGGKRIDAARIVMMEHTTATEAARQIGISVPGVSDLVKQLESKFKDKLAAFRNGQYDSSVRPVANDNLEDLFG